MTQVDRGKAKEELFPGVISELFWTLNRCVQILARGSAGLALELLVGGTPRLWSLLSVCGLWHQSAQYLGATADQASRVLLPGPLAWLPNPLPAFLSQANSLLSC